MVAQAYFTFIPFNRDIFNKVSLIYAPVLEVNNIEVDAIDIAQHISYTNNRIRCYTRLGGGPVKDVP